MRWSSWCCNDGGYLAAKQCNLSGKVESNEIFRVAAIYRQPQHIKAPLIDCVYLNLVSWSRLVVLFMCSCGWMMDAVCYVFTNIWLGGSSGQLQLKLIFIFILKKPPEDDEICLISSFIFDIWREYFLLKGLRWHTPWLLQILKARHRALAHHLLLLHTCNRIHLHILHQHIHHLQVSRKYTIPSGLEAPRHVLLLWSHIRWIWVSRSFSRDIWWSCRWQLYLVKVWL